MSGIAIEAAGLSAGYGGVPAITGVDLYVEAGEMVALLGANGAGKTTTLLALSGAVKTLAGKISVMGRLENRSFYKRARDGVALLPEQRAIFKGLTVKENLLLGRGDISHALALFPELERRLDVRAGLISGGEQQMLALGRVLVAKPRVLLADELSLGLAPLIVRRLLESLRTAAAQGTAVLIVEQHPKTALRWTNRGYVMRRGKVELASQSADLLARQDEITALYL